MDKLFFEEAYRKLKGSVYLDKTVPFLRTRIVEFENENFESNMEELYQAINSDVNWELIEKKIIESIQVLTFPKEVKTISENEEAIVISNVSADKVHVTKYNNFLDMCVEGHILGVLWILLVGYRLDDALMRSCYGNRLSDNLVFENEKTTASPNLFKPYFQQYESWRNLGLKKAEECVNSRNKSVIITMLDLTRYYYNVHLTECDFESMTAQYISTDNRCAKKINLLMYKILREYSIRLGKNEGCLLPIGFLPANILANYYLMNLDSKMQKCGQTVYYGRYVDDIILVTEVEDSDFLRNEIYQKGNGIVSEYMLSILRKNGIIDELEDDEYFLSGYSEMKFQKKKFRFFYIDQTGCNTIIEKIRKDISNNTSEFNYLPEDIDGGFSGDILKIEREDTVNKLRAINNTSIDKYVLSKTVGKNLLLSKFAEKKTIDNFIKNVGQLLNHKEIINNYTLWESILNYYILNSRWDEVVKFSALIVSALDNMEEDECKKSEPYEYLCDQRIITVGDSLVLFYYSCLLRATAIVWGDEIRSMLSDVEHIFVGFNRYSKYNALFDCESIRKKRKQFCAARMINKNLLPVSIEECMSAFSPSDNSPVKRLFSLDEYIELLGKKIRYRKQNIRFAPYIRSPFEILYTELLKQIRDQKEHLHTDKECIKFVCQEYAKNFNNPSGRYLAKYIQGDHFDSIERFCVNIQSKEKKKLRIAVANVKMNEVDIENILKGTKRSVSERCNEISRIINEAVRFRTDILIFPEAYIPISYLPVIQTKVAKHNMVIIGGVEHVKSGNLVYNLTTTILPIVNKFMSYAIPFFHSKVFFSPHEKEVINKYSCRPVEGKGHTLFKWRNIDFVTYCCYELTSISLRSLFQGYVDIIFGVEWNSDTHYFGNIMEALSRDIYCYCVQSNMSVYGDSRIIQPTKKDFMDIAKVKGGINGLIIVGEVDIDELRARQRGIKAEGIYKPVPAGWEPKR